MFSIRYLFRRMLRSSGFSGMVIAMIALGVGVNLGVLTITRSILFNSIGVPNADRLVYYTLGNGADTIPNFSGPGYEALRSEGAIKDLLAWKPTLFSVQSQKTTMRPMGALVTGNTFSVLKLKPYLGRFFGENDDRPGGKDGWVAVLGYDFWNAQMGHDPAVLGRTVLINGQPVRIIGVLPKDFRGISGLSPGIMLPRHFSEADKYHHDDFIDPGNLSWYVFGRLPDGLSLQNIQANLKSIEPSFEKVADPEKRVFKSLLPNTAPGHLLGVREGRHGVTSIASSIVGILAIEGLATLLLLFCGCNLLLLYTARAKREAQALAIRIALGAKSIHSVCFAMLEASLLTTIGYLAGIPLAWGIVWLFAFVVQSFIGSDVFSTISPSFSFFVVSFLITLAMASGIAACASIWQGRKFGRFTLRAGSTATSHQPNWVVGVEVFAALLLVITTLIGWMGFKKLSALPSGFASKNVSITSLAINGNENVTEKTDQILDRLRASPGVQSAATMSMPPLSGITANVSVKVRNKDGSISKYPIWPVSVSLQYFSTIGTDIIRGRGFIHDDLAGDSVCVISKRAQSTLGFAQDAIGTYLFEGSDTKKDHVLMPYCRIIGIAENAHFSSMSNPADAVVYLLSREPQVTLVVRGSSTVLATQAISNVVRSVAPESMITEIEPITSIVDRDLRIRKIITFAGMFCIGIAALILSSGVFGLLSLRVAEHKRELGIKIALGARPLDICFSVIRSLRKSVLVGVMCGSAIGLLIAKAIANSYGLDILHIFSGYLTGLILLAILLLAAAALPIIRALRTSPVECLSSE